MMRVLAALHRESGSLYSLAVERNETHHAAVTEITAVRFCSGQVSKPSQDLAVMSKKNTVGHASIQCFLAVEL